VTPPTAHSDPETPNSERFVTPGRFATLLALLVFVSWSDVLLGAGSFVLRDYSLFGYPIAHYHHDCFWRGELPLWNPLNNCGLPFLAQWNTLTLYPGALCYLLLPLPWSLGLFMLLHLWLGGFGVYALARRWTELNFPAAVAGVAYAFHGLVQQSLMWPNNLAAFALLPWVVLTVETGVREGGRKHVVAALVGALQMLTGAPEVILFTWLLVAALAAGRLFSVQCSVFRRCSELGVPTERPPLFTLHPSLFTPLLRLLSVIVLVTLLAAAQLLPFLELLHHSQRDAGFNGAIWSLPLWGAANLVSPLFQTTLSAPGVPFQNGQSWTASFYAGLPVLALALVAVRRGSSPRVWVLATVVLLSLATALGENGWLYLALKQIGPLGGMRYPAKFVIPLTFALPLLAAFALRDLLPAPGQPLPLAPTARRRLWGAASVLLALSVGLTLYGWKHPVPGEGEAGQHLLLRGTLVGGIALLLALAAVLGLARAGTPGRTLSLSLALLVLIFLDLKTHLPQLTPRVALDVYQPGHPLTQAPDAPRLGGPRAALTWQAAQEFRGKLLPSFTDTLLNQRMGLFGDLNLIEGLPKTDGFFSLYLRAQREVETQLIFGSQTNSLPDPILDFHGIAHLSSSTNLFQWHHRATALPLITAGQRPEFVAAEQTLTALGSPGWNPTATVFIHPWDRMYVPNTNATTAKVLSTHWTAHRIECEVDSPAPTLVVLAQAFYTPWQATVNGQPTNILRANYAFQAVPIPAGRSTVRLEYVDHRFQLGVGLSALGLLACCVLWCRAKPSASLITKH
jgi:hypothetical protein